MMPAARAPRGDDDDPFDDADRPAVVPVDPAEFLGRPGRAEPPGPGRDRDRRHPFGSDPGMRLAEHLKRAWVAAGRPRMSDVGDEVGYNKASISKVLSGKMPPAWHLVRKLGATLGVPDDIVRQEWHDLWVAADEQRRRRQSDPSGNAGRHQCAECGSWVADSEVHHLWHDRLDAAAPPNMPDAHRWATLRDALPGRNRRGD